MPEIFISYSSCDRQPAHKLSCDLKALGFSVWMDSDGIDGAMNWSSTIVEALNACSTVLFLISPHSAHSHNCAKEIQLASEKQKNILPVVLEETTLPIIFEYPLAGLHRVQYRELPTIRRALENLRAGKNALSGMTAQSAPVIQGDKRFRLAVLPFEDLSPDRPDGWLADGITDELINTLGSIGKLRVNPRGDVLFYRHNRPKLDEIAADLKCTYIVEGSVQKVGEKIRIHVSLSDAVEHNVLWRHKYDGIFNDIFELQDKTCLAIAEALQLELTPEEVRRIENRVTDDAEAYQLYLKALELFRLEAPEDLQRSVSLYEAAIDLDPQFAVAYVELANTYLELYRLYSRDPVILDHAEKAIKKAQELAGEDVKVLWVMASLALGRGNAEAAVELAQRSICLDPHYPASYSILGFAYQALGKPQQAVDAWEHVVALAENRVSAHFNLLIGCDELGDAARTKSAATRAIPFYEKHLRKYPDDFNSRLGLACVFLLAQNVERARDIAHELDRNPYLSGHTLYNLANLFLRLGEPERGLANLIRSVDHGYRAIGAFRRNHELDVLRGNPAFENLMRDLEQKISLESHSKSMV